ncbi:MAG: 4-hydroxy-tetrahydrodipicolinate reductase [Phycisphaerales bacterium]|nr:4-hydroxy-tetrahydrodipicolinate reductase [Phycisphaerales bacterium]
MEMIILAIAGAAGRMGRRLVALANEQKDTFSVGAAIDAPNSPDLRVDAGELAGVGRIGIEITSSLPIPVDVVIDFSAPAATRTLIAQCASRKIAMVIGTTGLMPADQKLIDEAAKSIAILQATNTSLGITVLLSVAAQVAKQLGEAYDIEIVEAHHNQKKDAPSGTALSLAESICKATGRNMQTDLVYGRGGKGREVDETRKKRTVGMHAVRMGDVVGEHTIYYATQGERIEIRHTASNRDNFARGALRAAAFLAKQKPGRYTMANVLGL